MAICVCACVRLLSIKTSIRSRWVNWIFSKRFSIVHSLNMLIEFCIYRLRCYCCCCLIENQPEMQYDSLNVGFQNRWQVINRQNDFPRVYFKRMGQRCFRGQRDCLGEYYIEWVRQRKAIPKYLFPKKNDKKL